MRESESDDQATEPSDNQASDHITEEREEFLRGDQRDDRLLLLTLLVFTLILLASLVTHPGATAAERVLAPFVA